MKILQRLALPSTLDCKTFFVFFSLCLVISLLMQFSRYNEMNEISYFSHLRGDPLRDLVETRGVEPLTSCLQGRRSPN